MDEYARVSAEEQDRPVRRRAGCGSIAFPAGAGPADENTRIAFLVGRGYLDESPNDPPVCDLSQAMGTAFDGMDFGQMKTIVDEAAKEGRWVIFVGHEIGERGYQITDVKALEELSSYLKDPANRIWLGAVEEIGRYIQRHRAVIAKSKLG